MNTNGITDGELRECWSLEVGTCFKVEGEEHLEYIKSLMGDRFKFYGNSAEECLGREPYLSVHSEFVLDSDYRHEKYFELVSMPIPDERRGFSMGEQDLVKKPKLLVIGSGRHGKDFFCEALCSEFGFTFKSSSEFMASKIFPMVKDILGYNTEQECFEDRHNHRGLWYELIGAFNHKDKAHLAKELLSKYDIYCGMRSKAELNECKKQGLFDLVVWIDASDRVDYVEGGDSISVSKDDADIVILNNGAAVDLFSKIDKVMSVMGVNHV